MSDQAWDELYVDIDDARADAIFQVAFKRLNEHFVQRLGRPAFVKALDAGTSEAGFARTRRIVKLPRPTKNVHERVLLEVCLGGSAHSGMLAWIYLEEGKGEPIPPPPWEGDTEVTRAAKDVVDNFTYTARAPDPEPLPFDMAAEPEDLPFK